MKNIAQTLLDIKANNNNTIDLNAYSSGLNDMYDTITLNMKKSVSFRAKGCVVGICYSGNTAMYPAKIYKSNTKEILIENINIACQANTIDSGFGFQRIKGAVMDITTITEITYEDKIFINEETESMIFGDLDEYECEQIYEYEINMMN
jgi:hypothetical protein